MRISIKARLTIYNALVISILFAALFLLIYRSLEVSLIASARETVLDSIEQVVKNAGKNDKINQRQLLRSIDGSLLVRVRTAKGRPILDSRKARRQVGPDSIWRLALSQHSAVTGIADLSSEAPDYVAAQKITIGGKLLVIEVAKPIGDSLDALDRLRSVLLIAGLVVAGLSLAGGYLLAYLALKPIDILAASAESISSTTLEQRLPVKNRSDEIGRLTITLNNLLSRLEQSFTRQRQFVSDAAHELATPLSSIRGHLGIIKSWGSAKPSVREEAINHIDMASQRMVTLINDLLALANWDEEPTLHTQEFSVLPVINQAVSRIADANRVTIKVSVDADIIVFADRKQFERLIIILIDNALKYTPADGQVIVSARPQTGRLFISVSDTGIGISPADLPRIFDRFYRTDKARARQTGGTGLGLAIAKAIVTAHGGEITADSTSNHGTTIRFWLPNLKAKYSS
ncbi:MAG TPA: HAMP domain-containing protein [Actinobacteria bacterium]|nr:HAMP domain-containing protein [Actinomycetes bacterium]HEX21714.1 HAMP domain-containing protein [Actinomycetota bacterium]